MSIYCVSLTQCFLRNIPPPAPSVSWVISKQWGEIWKLLVVKRCHSFCHLKGEGATSGMSTCAPSLCVMSHFTPGNTIVSSRWHSSYLHICLASIANMEIRTHPCIFDSSNSFLFNLYMFVRVNYCFVVIIIDVSQFKKSHRYLLT